MVTIDWVSDSSGNVQVQLRDDRYRLLAAVTNPGAATPTASYDITLTDDEGSDVLANASVDLTNRSATDTERTDLGTSAGLRPVCVGPLIVSVASAGASKNGRLQLIYTDY
jgi:hypothetical protein